MARLRCGGSALSQRRRSCTSRTSPTDSRPHWSAAATLKARTLHGCPVRCAAVSWYQHIETVTAGSSTRRSTVIIASIAFTPQSSAKPSTTSKPTHYGAKWADSTRPGTHRGVCSGPGASGRVVTDLPCEDDAPRVMFRRIYTCRTVPSSRID